MNEISKPGERSQAPRKTSRRYAWLLLIIVVSAAFAFVFIPAWVIMPFKAQTPRGVELSYTLKNWSPLVTAIAVVLAVILVIYLWRGARWFGRAALVIILIPAFIFTWFARQNHFEWMFNPLFNPAYARVNEADFINDRDMVMAVMINGEAAAYPVRQLAYHHVVQDRVGGVQVLTTY